MVVAGRQLKPAMKAQQMHAENVIHRHRVEKMLETETELRLESMFDERER